MTKTVFKRLFLLLLGPLAIAAVSAWLYLHGGRIVSTDNAYIKADIIDVSSEISGRVMSVNVDDNQPVAKGELLFTIDDRPYQIALHKAEAQLAEVRSNIASLKQEYHNSEIAIQNADTRLAYLDKELERVRSLLNRGSISVSAFDEAEYQWTDAQNNHQDKLQALQVVKARLIDPDLPVDEHPLVKQALAQLDSARLDLANVEVYAPTNGIAVNVSANEGENIVAGSPLMSVVDTQHLWIEANFKETDLTNMHPGQHVSVGVDTYPDRHWQGRVSSITPATGSEFSLLPAQNSSGNWVKVVQRVAVRIEFEGSEPPAALVAGMSALVEVDTEQQRTLPFISSL
ncbi:membrane protein [Pseudohongiella nitratireducens]|uniref:Membrane protein n=1 Tax=Pseudohongiella nitratireducens TaxID=1768907 RepID=A0A917GRT3_9GAMM|nr:HlyD family secretion protein [Pseudohongiella nitratireducens]GGG55203.1 membrane protein [Pseudohongiella nitratireducens]